MVEESELECISIFIKNWYLVVLFRDNCSSFQTKARREAPRYVNYRLDVLLSEMLQLKKSYKLLVFMAHLIYSWKAAVLEQTVV